MKIHLGFLTNNAGDDIPGSTIKWTIKTYGSFFDSVIVVDGNLTHEAKKWYATIPNIWVKDSPWTGRHVDQYRHRDNGPEEGDWILSLDCDESPTTDLAFSLKDIITQAETNDVVQIGMPAKGMWCKNNSKLFYPIDKPENVKNPSKWVLYKIKDPIKYITNQTGTHVTPIVNGPRAAISLPYFHFKSPETTAFNAAICLMDDLIPLNEDPCSPIRGLSRSELDKLEAIGKKYDLLQGPKFRKLTKEGAWPKELEDLIRTFKNPGRGLFARSMYTTYFVFLNAGKDDNRLTYDEACEIADFNQNYKLRKLDTSPMIVEHTDVLLKNVDLPCGAG